MRSRPLIAQILAINALLVSATVLVASLATRLDIHLPLERRTFLVLLLAICVLLLLNAFLLRRRFAPLERIIATMEEVDLGQPGVRAVSHAADSVEAARVQNAFNRMLERLEQERRDAARAVLGAQERERQRIARDLHDEVNQALTALLLRLEAARQSAPAGLQKELTETKALAAQAMDELLGIARELRPSALDDLGLLSALQTQVRDFGDRTGIEAEFHRQGPVGPLTDEQQLVIYRVTQESLSNAAQHARASHVKVELSFVGRTVLRVTDDGAGLPTGQNGGSGLSGMRERALQVGARLNVRSTPGAGTTIELVLA